MSQLSQPSDAGDLQHLELVVTKETPTTRIGIKLRNSRRRRLGSQIEVEIVEVLANGPLAGIVKEGDTLVAVDGIPCLSGHEMVLESFAEKVGDIKLTIKPLHPKSPTFPRRLVSISTDAGGELDSGAPLSTPRSSGPSPLRSLQRPTSSLQPSGSGPRAADLPLVPRAATEAMLKGVYSEILVVSAPLPAAPASLSQGDGQDGLGHPSRSAVPGQTSDCACASAVPAARFDALPRGWLVSASMGLAADD